MAQPFLQKFGMIVLKEKLAVRAAQVYPLADFCFKKQKSDFYYGGFAMSEEKIIKSRQRQKIDTSENWHTAGENGFTPLAGEIIVYSDGIDGNGGQAIKIGDGEKTVNELDYVGDYYKDSE